MDKGGLDCNFNIPLAYATLMTGLALSLLLLEEGFVILGVGVLLTFFLHWIINPKLKAISEEYEKKQKEYLERLEKIVKWRKDEKGTFCCIRNDNSLFCLVLGFNSCLLFL